MRLGNRESFVAPLFVLNYADQEAFKDGRLVEDIVESHVKVFFVKRKIDPVLILSILVPLG